MSDFTEAVNRGCEGLEFISPGVCPGCSNCQEELGYCCEHSFKAAYEAGEIEEEGSFSWSACECCGSPLGGDRHVAHGVDADGEIVHFSVCVDCMLYLANGDEPEDWEG